MLGGAVLCCRLRHTDLCKKFFLYFHLVGSLWGAAAAGGNCELALPASLRSSSASSQTSSLTGCLPKANGFTRAHCHSITVSIIVQCRWNCRIQQCALFVPTVWAALNVAVTALKQIWVWGEFCESATCSSAWSSVSNFNSNIVTETYLHMLPSSPTKLSPQ